MELLYRITFRLNKKDNTKLKQVASEQGLTVSKYVRKLIITALWAEKV